MKNNTDKTTSKAGAGAESAQSSVVKINPEYKLEKVTVKAGGYRPSLQNVKLAKTKRFGNCAVATNGRSMAVVPIKVQDGENDGGLLSVEALKASRKNRPVKGSFILNGKIELPGGAVLPRPDESEFRFPNWEQVIPEYPITFEIVLNVKLLAELCEAIGAKDEIVCLSFSDALNPVVVTRNRERSNGEYGVLMPGRVS
jgi:hypothetical protein